ncbi:MAG TPA: hemolysin family protein [Spirochaetales bacterium]|nr:hemolysin family protein [Spirochaetales bacterium]
MSPSLAGVIICLVFSAVFSASETAFTSLSIFQIQNLRKRYRQGRIVEKLAREPEVFLSTILIGNNVVNILASVLATEYTLERWGDRALGAVTGVITLAVLIFGEVTPKRLAIAHNEFIAVHAARFILVLSYLLRPAVGAINFLSSLVTRIFGKTSKTEMSLETMTQMLAVAESAGVIDFAKSSMVKNIFRMGTMTVQAVMTHRIDVFSLDGRTTAQEAATAAVGELHSRFPVYDEDPEKIVGVVALKRVLDEVVHGRRDRPIREIMAEPVLVMSTKPLGELFDLLKRRKESFAVVLDEYGGLAGVVTIRDVIEEIVGEIYEDGDEEPRERLRRRADGSYTVSGDAPLSLVADVTGTESPGTVDIQTVAGYVAWILDRIPVEGDVAHTPLGRFTVLKVEANRVEEAVFRPAPQEVSETE